MLVRLQKYLADAGVASRRASEKLILDGHISLNGRVVRELGTKVNAAEDLVQVDGVAVKVRKKLYVAINKPPGYICSRNDPEGRPEVGALLPREWGNLYSVGRLDYNSEGLIFYTNDGDFSLKLTHPRYGIAKKYWVTVVGMVTQEQLQPLIKGIKEEGELLKAESARIIKANHSRSVVEVILREGKNREIRRLFAFLGIEIERLQRLQIGKVKLGELPKGRWRTLTQAEIKSLIAPQN
ncbi:MAG: pseudouridine synthase [Verrucomicrobiota bacterium]|nr:pseudouridine synthase [Verrucomicrobiota bacterium]